MIMYPKKKALAYYDIHVYELHFTLFQSDILYSKWISLHYIRFGKYALILQY